jgi:hypothetical protein
MAFDRFKAMADEVKTKGQELAGAALGKLTESQQELNRALPVLKALGLSVGNFKVDMAMPPVVRLALVGAVAAIEPEQLKATIDTHKDEKLLVMVLEALRTAAFMKDQLGELGLRGVRADVALALPPSVSVDFMKDPPAVAV